MHRVILFYFLSPCHPMACHLNRPGCQVVGPNTPTPETFAEALFADTSTWALTDRGRLEAMVPVTVLLEQAASQIVVLPNSNTDKELKKKFEVSQCGDTAVRALLVSLLNDALEKAWGCMLRGT